jgi:hypothetical protein
MRIARAAGPAVAAAVATCVDLCRRAGAPALGHVAGTGSARARNARLRVPDDRLFVRMDCAGLYPLLWDEGFRRGDSQLLAVMAYATPLCSALLLAVFGLESLTWTLGLGALVIVAAGLLSRSD